MRLEASLGLPLRVLEHCPSTMDEAAAWAREGAPHMACVMTSNQTAGRGRLGRTWRMFEGHSFAATYVVRGLDCPHLPLLAGVAVGKMLDVCMLDVGKKVEGGLQKPALSLKWPNDMLIGGRKAGGILVETFVTYQHTNIPTYLVGIGLNLTRPPHVEPDFEGAFVADMGLLMDAQQVYDALTPCLDDVLGLYTRLGWPALAGEYVRLSCTIGSRVAWVNPHGGTLEGQATGLTPHGALVVVNDAGEVHHIHSGDVIAQGRRHEAISSATGVEA